MTMHSRHSLTVLVGWAPPKVAVQLSGNDADLSPAHYASLGAKILSVPGEIRNYYCAVLRCLKAKQHASTSKECAAKACEVFLQ